VVVSIQGEENEERRGGKTGKELRQIERSVSFLLSVSSLFSLIFFFLSLFVNFRLGAEREKEREISVGVV